MRAPSEKFNGAGSSSRTASSGRLSWASTTTRASEASAATSAADSAAPPPTMRMRRSCIDIPRYGAVVHDRFHAVRGVTVDQVSRQRPALGVGLLALVDY